MPPLVQLLARWNALPRTARVVAGCAPLVLAALVLAAALATHPSRSPLFSAALHPEQLAEVEERLAEWNVPFTPTSDNVVVDGRRRNDLLLKLSLAGVPHSHVAGTSEALSTIGVLTPQAVIDAQARSGLAGDIEAGLRGIDGVDDARVIVAPGRSAEFAQESPHDASASVRLRLRAGSALSNEAIAGIRAFVAASVPELEPARVTVLDDRGVALGADSASPDDAAYLQNSLQSALDAAFGTGAAIVRVRAEYDPAGSSEHDTRRVPVDDAIERSRRSSETYDEGPKHYRRMDDEQDRGSEMRESVSRVPAGALKRLYAAVFVDNRRSPDLAKLRHLAAATVGYDSARGDTLAVESVDFRRASVGHASWRRLTYDAMIAILPALLVASGIVAAARFALPPAVGILQALAERKMVEQASKAAAGFPPARVRSMLEQEPPHAAAAIISALPAATATAVLELYPPHEREAIVTRMQRRHSPLLGDAHELIRRRV